MFYEITFVFSNKEFEDFQPQAQLETDIAPGFLDTAHRRTGGRMGALLGETAGVWTALGVGRPAGWGSQALGPESPQQCDQRSGHVACTPATVLLTPPRWPFSPAVSAGLCTTGWGPPLRTVEKTPASALQGLLRPPPCPGRLMVWHQRETYRHERPRTSGGGI